MVTSERRRILTPPPKYCDIYANPSENTIDLPSYDSETFPLPYLSRFGSESIPVYCVRCHRNIYTCVTYESGFTTWLSCTVLALSGCILGCCLIPFFMPETKDATHTCPNCHFLLGHFIRD
ncbi:hypothetical protein ACHWQZ_G016922 [Mnemiopsis leidyi]